MRLTIVSKFYRDIPEFRDVLISWMKSQARNVGYVFCYESGLKIEFFSMVYVTNIKLCLESKQLQL